MLSIDEAKQKAKEVDITEQLAPLSVFRVLLRHPSLAKEVSGTLMALLTHGNKLDPRLRELLIMRIGWVTGATYEWTQHWRVSKGIGLSDAEITGVRDWRNSDALTAADKAILAATDDTLNDGKISAETWAACCEHLKTAEERIELVLAIGNWSMFSQLLQSLNIPLEDGIDAWPPDGLSPN
jgi:alkylhydroperoxidase family enzyme